MTRILHKTIVRSIVQRMVPMPESRFTADPKLRAIETQVAQRRLVEKYISLAQRFEVTSAKSMMRLVQKSLRDPKFFAKVDAFLNECEEELNSEEAS